MQLHPAQFSFADGEQSPFMLASELSRSRGQLPVKAAVTVENFTLLPQGGLLRRTGTEVIQVSPHTKMIPLGEDMVMFSGSNE
jgi:hypothetical protein